MIIWLCSYNLWTLIFLYKARKICHYSMKLEHLRIFLKGFHKKLWLQRNLGCGAGYFGYRPRVPKVTCLVTPLGKKEKEKWHEMLKPKTSFTRIKDTIGSIFISQIDCYGNFQLHEAPILTSLMDHLFLAGADPDFIPKGYTIWGVLFKMKRREKDRETERDREKITNRKLGTVCEYLLRMR